MEKISKMGDTKRVDRLIVGDSDVYVIDYKSSKDDIRSYKDKAQVSTYVKLIKGMFPGKNVKGYIIYIKESESEEI